MGRRGPPPKPTVLKLLDGNPGRTPINRNEPVPSKADPECPDWLTDEARRAWQRIVPELKRLNLLTVVDGDALVIYCQTWALWRKTTEFLQKHGETYPLKDEKGRLKCLQQWPQVSIQKNCAYLLRQLQQDFGLNPAARSRIMVPLDGEENDKALMQRFFGTAG